MDNERPRKRRPTGESMIKNLFFLVITLLFVLDKSAFSKEALLTGHIGKGKYSIAIQITKDDPENNNVIVELVLSGKVQKIKFPGYDTGHLIVQDLNGDGNDEVLFLYYQGAELYDLGLIGYKDGYFQAFDADDFGGRDFELVPFHKKYLVALKQEDEKGYYFFTDLAELKDQKLVSSNATEAWERVIRNVYLPWLKKEKTDQGKSRINSYIYLAYKKIDKTDQADNYYQKAKALDPTNPNLK